MNNSDISVSFEQCFNKPPPVSEADDTGIPPPPPPPAAVSFPPILLAVAAGDVLNDGGLWSAAVDG